MDGTGGHLVGALPGEGGQEWSYDAPGKAEFWGGDHGSCMTSPFIKVCRLQGPPPGCPGIRGLSFASEPRFLEAGSRKAS